MNSRLTLGYSDDYCNFSGGSQPELPLPPDLKRVTAYAFIEALVVVRPLCCYTVGLVSSVRSRLLGVLSVVICAILSSTFLKEKLSFSAG